MSEQVDGGEKDGVVYLGRSSFKMKVGVQLTPPAGTVTSARARLMPTPSPSAKTPPPLSKTPPPSVLRTSRRPSGPHTQPPTPREESLLRGVTLAKATLIGLCLTTFSFGAMFTMAVDRYWPRPRREAGEVAAVGAAPALSAPAIAAVETAPEPPPPVQAPRQVTPLPPAPAPAPAEPVAVAAPDAPVAAPKLAAAPEVRAAARKTAAPAAAPAPKAPVAAAARGRAVTLVPVAARGRAIARKRAGTVTSTAPTESWTDPFE